MSDNFLKQLLEQSEHIHQLIRQAAEALSSVHTGVRNDCSIRPGAETGLPTNQAIAEILQDASEELTAVHQALRIEIRDRTMVDHQLAAALEQEEGARNAALHDQLTGLPNRTLFKDRLEHGIAQAKRHRWILAVMFVDLDKFKSVNDAYGHQSGDAVLQTVAMRLKQHTRGDDTVSRYGGDEFLCLLTRLHEQKDMAMIAAKLLEAIRAPCSLDVRGVVINPDLGASIGISVYPKDGETASALIRKADEAMYEAKERKSGYAFAQ